MDKKIIVGVAIVIVIVAAAAAFMALKGSNDSEDSAISIDTDKVKLVVFGNANNDNYLNQADVTYIQNIISGSIEWDKKTNPLADANNDGVIDQKDVDLVKTFLNGGEATMYYVTQTLSVASIHYPLTGNAAVFFDSSLAMAQIVGFYDDVTHMARPQSYIDNLSKELYPGSDKLIAYGGYPYEYEKVVASGVSFLLGDKFVFTDDFVKRINESTDIDCILLPNNRVVNGMNWTTTLITLGVMANKQANTADYITYVDEVESLIEKNLSGVSAKEKTFLIAYDPDPNNPNSIEVTIHGTGVTQFGDICNIETLPLTCVKEPVGESGDVTGVQMEEILSLDPDIIFISTWEMYMPDMSEAEYMEILQKKADIFSGTRAYKEGNIYALPYEVYGTLPGISGMTYLASMIWPDKFSTEQGIAYIQEWYDKFTPVDIDVTETVGILPVRLGNTA